MRKYTTELFRLVTFLICIIGILFLFTSLISKQDGIGMMDSVEPVSISGIISVNGNIPENLSHSSWHKYDTHSVIVQGHFDHPITNGQSLIIWPRNIRLKDRTSVV